MVIVFAGTREKIFQTLSKKIEIFFKFQNTIICELETVCMMFLLLMRYLVDFILQPTEVVFKKKNSFYVRTIKF